MKRLILPLLLLLAACATAPVPGAAPAPSAAPRREPAPARSPNALTPHGTPAKTIADPRIRVGMLTDQSTVSFPRIEGGYVITTDSQAGVDPRGNGGAWTIRRGFAVTAPLANAVVRYAVQVAALSDRTSVEAFVARVKGESGQRVDAIFDPSAANGGLYRILAGVFPDVATATPLREDLVRRGYGLELAVVRRPSDQPFEKRLLLADDEGDSQTFTAPTVLVLPADGETININQKAYRTAARLFINPRGLVNVINELSLEDYLKGVVPAELGPRIYDEIEALKAQAIAARTYAVRNLNGFPLEGFDICPGPACQAYSGFGGEDPLSTRAVTETAGLVMMQGGQPIDALYTSTCGGETSDVGTMFPGRDEPYLKRVRCVELETVTVSGRGDSGMLGEWQVNARIFAAVAGLPEWGSSWSGADVGAALTAAARVIGWPVQAGGFPAASSRRGDVLRTLATMFRLGANARVLTLPEDRRYYFPQSADPESLPYLAAAFLTKYGIWPAQEIDRLDLNAAMPREELYAILGAWVREHEVLAEVSGKIAAVEGRRLSLKSEGKVTAYLLPPNIPVVRRLGDRFQEYASVPVMIGDRAVLLRDLSGVASALIVVANYDGASFDRTSSFANWTRSYRAEALVKSINNRNPIQQLVDLRPVRVDESQRVAELEVTAEGGRKFILKGLPVRWSLNVPDNLFVFDRTKDPDGTDRYTFYGKGWGHGVGMCQVGAYGMAFRGWSAEKILKHYYTGIEIVPMNQGSGK